MSNSTITTTVALPTGNRIIEITPSRLTQGSPGHRWCVVIYNQLPHSDPWHRVQWVTSADICDVEFLAVAFELETVKVFREIVEQLAKLATGTSQ
jgi:hypothetical protein